MPRRRARRRAMTMLSFLLVALPGCDEDPMAPRAEDFGLDVRNFVTEDAGGERFTPFFDARIEGGVDTDAIREMNVVWPGELATTPVSLAFMPYRGGFRTLTFDPSNDRALPSGTYLLSVSFRNGDLVTRMVEKDIVLLEGPEDVQVTIADGGVTVTWSGPVQEHGWAVAMFAVEGTGGDLSLVDEGPTGESVGGGSFEVAMDFGDGVDPGQEFLVRLLLENEDNVRSYDVRSERPS